MCRRSLTLFDQDSARSMGIAVHGTIEKMEEHVASTALQRWSDYEEKKSKKRGKEPSRPRVEGPSDEYGGNPQRYMAVVSIPYYDAQTKLAESGFLCSGCRNEPAYQYGEEWNLDWNRKFSTETFIDHVKQWGKIKDHFHLQV